MTTRIDVHAHYLPDFYREALVSAGLGAPDGSRAAPPWAEQTALDALEQLDLRAAVLSISSPGVHFGDDAAAAVLARRCNDEGARLVRDHPGRFGLFAILPLPDVDAAIIEAARALDELGADGVTLLTNARGLYVGDPAMESLWSELDRRSAVVFLHPTTPPAGDVTALGLPRSALEFPFDTTRAVVQMITSGLLERYPNVRVIVPHAGGVLPVVAGRADLFLPTFFTAAGSETPPSVRDGLRALHFDLAGAPVPELLDALLAVADPGRILYGSDVPFTSLSAAVALAAKLDDTGLLDESLRERVMLNNALDLVPRLR